MTIVSGKRISQIMAEQCHKCKHRKPYKRDDCSIRKACIDGNVPKSAILKMFEDGQCKAFNKKGKERI